MSLVEKKSTVSTPSGEYKLLVTHRSEALPKHPLSVYINESGNSTIGCYIYSIGSKSLVYSTTLQNTSDNQLFDLTKNLGVVLTKKYQCPLYVSISGLSLSVTDYSDILRQVVATIDGAAAC